MGQTAMRNASAQAGREPSTEMLSRTVPIIVRCLFSGHGDHWEAFTLEYGLAVQASSFREVKDKLESMILSYVNDALIGEDREHAEILLARRATAKVYARYYYIKLRSHFSRPQDGPHNSSAYPIPFKAGLCST